MAKIANVALTNTFDTWRTRSNEAFDRLSQFAINNSSLYANTLTANVSFTSKGLATMQGRATVGTNLTVSGNTTTNKATVTSALTVSGNTTLGGANKTLTIGGAGATANATGWFGVNGRQSISTNLFVGGNTILNGTGTVSGLFAASGRATVGTNLTVSGNTTLGGASKTVTVGGAGATTNATGWFGVTGRATVSTNLFVGGNTTLNGTTIDKSNALSQTLTDGATINWDISLGRVATVTLGGNRTMAAPTNLKVGTYILTVIQDATGSRTITWNSVFKWTAGVAPPLTTTANAKDVFSFFSDGTNLFGSFMPDVR